MSRTHCLVCGTDAAGHRVVVSLDSGDPVGGFCPNCESAVFGDCLDRFRAVTPELCLACEREATHAFVDWLDRPGAATRPSDDAIDPAGSESSPDDGLHDAPADTASESEDTDAPPRVCRTHFQALTSDASDWGHDAAGFPTDRPR